MTTDATRHALEHIKGLPKHFTLETLRTYLLSRAVRTPSGCLEFRGYGNNHRVHQKGPGRAWSHIAAYAAFIGDYDPTKDIDHSCNNPPCIEPTHLRQMTHAENMSRVRGKIRRTSCDHPREYAEDGRFKRCRICNAANQQRWRQRKADATTPDPEPVRPWVVEPPKPLFDLAS